MSAAGTTTPGTFDCRVAFAEELTALARQDRRIVAVCNDSVGSSNLVAFAKELPERLVNVGIAEQDMVGVAAGLANAGYVPFVCCAAPFLTGRALEQIKNDIAYSDYHVVLCGMSPGMAYGELGPTHHSIEDVAWLRAISNMTLLIPADPTQTRQALRWAAHTDHPVYMRIGRFPVPNVTPEGKTFEVGRAMELREGRDLCIVATGTMVSRALEAAEQLESRGYQARVLNLPTVKPLDAEALVRAAAETGRIVAVEESVVEGGTGSAIAALLAARCPVPMRILGVPEFAPTGDAAFLLDHFGLNAAGIEAAALELLS
ncbi:transketolase family protein [Sorangium sp. So ce1389]|uniref:transketolase family protein n=1 Tax=Sorangium sp. So ce1389 TaxID=3133336 RepID=UPI003F60642B